MHGSWLRLLVFTGGLVTLGAELSASRLVAPFFGSSLVVWSSLIGLILVCLSIGYWVGGTWIDRRPEASTLLMVSALAGFSIAVVPFVSRPLLGFALHGLDQFEAGLLVGSFLGVLLLMGIPMLLLGCITPMAIRLATTRVEESGRVTGQLFALSTLGSFIGSFLPVLVLIPAVGTRMTFFLLGLALLVVTALGAFSSKRTRSVVLCLALSMLAALPAYAMGKAPLKPGEDVVYEGESAYHYIKVTEDAAGWRSLWLNEGVVTHSKYHPQILFTGGEWDYISMAPYFNPAPYNPMEESRRWAFIGGGAGTSMRLVANTIKPDHIDAVEIDAEIIRVGNEFFEMAQPQLNVVATDGRSWLRAAQDTYDVIAVDAYRQPYIPFELTTVEFFTAVREHLTEDGVLAMNVGRGPHDTRVLDTLTTTIHQVFDHIYLLDLYHKRNTVVVATVQPTDFADFYENLEHIEEPFLRIVAQRARTMLRMPEHGGVVFTDDRAPIELLMDKMVFGEIKRLAE